MGSVVKDEISKLLPEDLSVEHLNVQYLQKHSGDGRAILASAKVSQLLGTPMDQVENSVFSVFNPDASLDVKVSRLRGSRRSRC